MSGLWQQAKDALTEKRGLLAAGTPGPWRRNPDRWAPPDWEHDMAYLRVEAGEPHPSSGLGKRIFHTDGAPLGVDEDMRHEADVAKAVAAVNDYGLMLDALEAVLDRHAPRQVRPPYSSRTLPPKEECRTCRKLWPCADAQAVLTALGLRARADSVETGAGT